MSRKEMCPSVMFALAMLTVGSATADPLANPGTCTVNWQLSGEDYLVADQLDISPDSATAEMTESFDVIRTDHQDGTVDLEIIVTNDDSIQYLLIESIDIDGFDLNWSGTLDGEPATGTLSLAAGDEEGTVVLYFAGDFEYATQIDVGALQTTVGISIQENGVAVRELEPISSDGTKCVCFGKPDLTECSDDQCTTMEECPGGNGGPKCRWQFWVTI